MIHVDTLTYTTRHTFPFLDIYSLPFLSTTALFMSSIMASATETQNPYNNYFVPEKDLKYVPPYLRDVPETTDEVQCPTTGTWPTWLEGSFLRMGAGKFTIPLSEDGSNPNAVLQHFFDGLGMLHTFRMGGGRVYYSSRHTAKSVV